MQEFETIKRARTLLAASQSSPSESTTAGYKKRAMRLVRKELGEMDRSIDSIIARAKESKSASTWFGNRAALTYSFRQMIAALLAQQDKAQRALKAAQVPESAPAWESWRDMVEKVRMWTDWVERLQAEPGPPIAERRARHSKRKDMKDLPDDWRERLIARLPSYRIAALTEAVTGCRPAELVHGVRLEIKDGEIIATIAGAKVTGKTGQPWRRLAWPVDSESPLVRALAAEVERGAALVKIEDAKTYSGAVRAAGKREWPRKKEDLAPYCFRHAAASDMKAAGMEDLDISAALGHCSDVAKKYYGSWQQGSRSGGVAPKAVTAARPVRAMAKKPKAAGRYDV